MRIPDLRERLLSRENSQVLRGIAIIFIMLHNFLHLKMFGFSAENEMSFLPERASSFFAALAGGSHLTAEFFSHLGWIGVGVFVFLTGYGVALRQPPVNREETAAYVKRSYLKLLVLMLPAVLFFAVLDVFKGDLWPGLGKRFSYLTMLVNFAYPYLNCNPGVYWYFGLTFQFYLLWALFGRRMNGKNLLIWSEVFLVGLLGLNYFRPLKVLTIYRRCFPGWFLLFAAGVILARFKSGNGSSSSKTSLGLELLCFVLLFGMIFLCSRWMVPWVFLDFVALAWFLVFGLMILRTRYLSAAFRWLGRLSACLFVCHPIARTLVLNAVYPRFQNQPSLVLIYLALSIIIALCYQMIYRRCVKR